MCKLAYIVQEDFEGMGDVIFARTPIEARRAGANEWNDGELGGMHVKRCSALDGAIDDPRKVRRTLIDLGWWFDTPDGEITADDEPFVTKSGGVYSSPYSWLRDRENSAIRKAARNAATKKAWARFWYADSIETKYDNCHPEIMLPHMHGRVRWDPELDIFWVQNRDLLTWKTVYRWS